MGMLDGKVAIVTGAGRGLGREEAIGMAREGCNLVINDLGGNFDGTVLGIETKVADEVVDECKKLGVKAIANYDSVTDFNKAKGMVDQAIAEFGKLDILVNNAGYGLAVPHTGSKISAEMDIVFPSHQGKFYLYFQLKLDDIFPLSVKNKK